ncbi:MAG: 50S ribosomal protein L6 [Candidatus Diapherotrites archaeon]
MVRKNLLQEIEIPENVEIGINGKEISVKGPEGENIRKFDIEKIKIEKKDGKIIIEHPSATKKEKRKINTIIAHLKNMIRGVQKKFEYKLKICAVHFPITIEIKGNKVLIKNFLGEKTPRKCSIPEGAEIEINKDIITTKSVNREIAGQAAANFEAATRVRNRDRRVFQDGIFIINKIGKEI